MQEALLIPGQIVIEKEIILLYRKKKKKSLSNSSIAIKTVSDRFSFYFFPGAIPPPASLSPGVSFILVVVVEGLLQ